jgi:hypothetical protein
MAAAGTSQRAPPKRVLNEGTLGRARCGRINLSWRNAISMEFHTLGLGSCAACSWLAAATI